MNLFFKLVGITFLSLVLTRYAALPFLERHNGYAAYLYIALMGVIVGLIMDFTNSKVRALIYLISGIGIYLNFIYAGHFLLLGSFQEGALLAVIGLTLIVKLAILTPEPCQ